MAITYLLDDIESILIAKGVVPSGWVLFKSRLPDTPDRAMSLHETGGYGVPDSLGTANQILSFQARVRAGRFDYEVAKVQWQVLFNALHGASQVTPQITYIMALGDGPLVFFDPEDRPNLTTNFKVLKVRQT